MKKFEEAIPSKKYNKITLKNRIFEKIRFLSYFFF